MGTQQILLIVLSVIIVGIAVAVGITMFNAQATNSNRQAIVGDMNNQASSALAYWKTPLTHGGGAGSFGSDDGDDVGTWIGYDWDGTILTTGNGTFTLAVADPVLTIVGTGTEVGSNGSTNVSATMTVNGTTSLITTVIDN